MRERIRRLRTFIGYDIWRITENEVSRRRLFLLSVLKTLIVAVRRFRQDRVMSKAAALTYSTLFSIVPMLAILFSIARRLGVASLLEAELRGGMGGQTAAAETLLQLSEAYLARQHARSGVFIGVGVALLLWTVINLIGNIETTFNRIWEVKKGRSLYRKATDYLSMLLLLPLLIVASAGLSIFTGTALRHMADFALLTPVLRALVRTVPFVLTWLMFTGLYLFMPNTKVGLRHAMASGIVAGTLYQAFQYLYIGSQIWVSRYNAIYGSFAAIPLFLLWLQTSWTICLFGAELAYAGQNIRLFSFEKDTRNASRRYRDFVCLLVMSLVCKRSAANRRPYTAEELSAGHRIPIRLVHQALYRLQETGLLDETAAGGAKGGPPAYVPAMDTGLLSVGVLLERLDTHGSESFKVDREREFGGQWAALVEAREEYYHSGRGILLRDL